MRLDDVGVAAEMRHVATLEEVARAEEVLKVAFPPGYAEYVTTLGEGTLSAWVRVYPPWLVVDGLRGWRERVATHWFWEHGERKLSRARAGKCVLVADTLGGDELVFHPSKPDRLYVLPHDGDDVFVVDGTLWDAVDWLCTSGTLTQPLRDFRFEPSAESSRREIVAEPAPKLKRPTPGAGPPSRSPEETLAAFWDAYTALGEDFERSRRERDEEKKRRGQERHVLTPEELADLERFDGLDRQLWEAFFVAPYESGVYPSSDQYSPRWRERIDRAEVKGTKAYIYGRRPEPPTGEIGPRSKKYRWVLELTDGEWQIKARQKEGAKTDAYRPCSVKIG